MMNCNDPLLLLEQALSKGIAENEGQERHWLTYERSHCKVAEALQEFQKELSVNCLVPIGKRALMRGNLIHTNEVLTSLGAGYFAKMTACQATRLCERRMDSARQNLEELRKERELYEMKLLLLPQEKDGKDIEEHWDEGQIEQWRLKHREREKEYRKKLSEEKGRDIEDPEDEADLFRRLDELEIEEELEEFGEELDEETSSSDEENVKAIIEEELQKLNLMRREISNRKSVTFCEPIEESPPKLDNVKSSENPKKLDDLKTTENPQDFIKELKTLENSESSQNIKTTKCLRFSEKSEAFNDTENSEQLEDDENVIKIEFSHTNNEVEKKSTGLESPGDIFEKFSGLKSILKTPENWIPPEVNFFTQNNEGIKEEDEEEEEEEEGSFKPSAYEVVVKDITERKIEEDGTIEPVVQKEEKKISKFRRERSIKK